MGATQEQQSDPDQAGISNAAIGAAWALCVAIFVGAFWQIIEPMPKSPAVLAPYRCFVIGLLLACLMWAYLTVRLGGANEASEHRSWYKRFRARIIGGDASGYYASTIRGVLARVDKFFGDGGQLARRNWTHRAFGLQAAAPLWTAPAYDRCLMLALIYPVTVIILVWGWSGHIGAAETALGVSQSTAFIRTIFLFGVVVMIVSAFISFRISGWQSKFFSTFAGTLALAYLLSDAGAAIFSAGIFGLLILPVSGSTAVATVFAFSFICVYSSIFALIFAFVFAALRFTTKERENTGIRLFLFTVIILIVIFMIVPSIAGYSRSATGLTLLYFLSLLTLVNAPFDWLSLGMTRGLLRRGLDRGGVEPIFLGVLDLIISIIVMAMLAIAVLWATEIFNHAVISGGGKVVVDPARQLALLANPATRGDYEHWWLYAMLFSTQLPAIANITFGTFCLLRGLPRVNRWMASLLPANGGIGLWQRLGVATATAVQLVVAVTLGLVSLYYLYFWGLVALVDATFGVTLIELLGSASLRLD